MKPSSPGRSRFDLRNVASLLAAALGSGLLFLFCWQMPATTGRAAVGAGGDAATKTRAKPNAVIRPQDMAEVLRTVLASERYVLTAQQPTLPQTSPDGRPLPPCTLTRMIAEEAQTRGVDFSYAVRAEKPLVDRNTPQTDFERRALSEIAQRPDQVVTNIEVLGGRRYFTAIYPEKVEHPGCAKCHSPGGATNAPIGMMVLRVPLEL